MFKIHSIAMESIRKIDNIFSNYELNLSGRSQSIINDPVIVKFNYNPTLDLNDVDIAILREVISLNRCLFYIDVNDDDRLLLSNVQSLKILINKGVPAKGREFWKYDVKMISKG